MSGILAYGAYLPRGRLARDEIRTVVATGGGKGRRTVASYDEDTTTMGVEAARLARRSVSAEISFDALWFSTVSPAYLDKTNATAIHAALGIDRTVIAADFGGATRSGIAALLAALRSNDTTLLVSADVRIGLAGSADETSGGDAGAAVIVGHGPVIAELAGSGSVTAEFTDRWRTPGDVRSKTWEERFGESQYVPCGEDAWNLALKEAAVAAEDIDRIVVTGPHGRAVKAFSRRIGAGERLVDDLSATVGWTGAASPALLLGAALDDAAPGELIAIVSLADGADVVLLRTTEAIASYEAAHPVAEQATSGADVAYGTYLAWRGLLQVQPPNRPEPARVSSSAAARATEWKFSFGGRSDEVGTITTFTIDRLAYSPSPPVVFAIVDFDDGNRRAIDLTDVEADEVAIGNRVEMTFRRLGTADGIHNYFWKARLVR